MRHRLAPAADSLLGRLTSAQRAALLVSAAVTLAGLGVLQRDLGRAVVGLFGFTIFVVIAVSGRLVAITTIVGWLVLLGFIRRLLIPFAGWSPQDPLLLVGPAAAVVLWATAYHNSGGRPPGRHAVTSVAAFLLVWTLAEIFNPLQPGLSTAAAGTLFYIGPLLWIFAGRRFSAAERQRVLDTVFWMTIPVLASGYYQTFVGLLPFELHWIGVSGVGPAIFLPGYKIRPFATLVSPQEYGVFLSFSLAVIWSRLLYARRRRGWLALMLMATVVALFYQASRETFSLFLIAFLVMALMRARSAVLSLTALATVSLGALLLLSGSAGRGGPSSPAQMVTASQGAGVLAQHQLQFFQDPTGGTTGAHVQLVTDAFDRAYAHPLGLGPSTGNLASRQPQPDVPSAEVDFANIAQGLGWPAEIAYWVLVASVFAAAFRLQRRAAGPAHLAWIGILVGGFLQWMSGGLYCTSAITGMVLGGLPSAEEELPPMSPPAAGGPLPAPAVAVPGRGDR